MRHSQLGHLQPLKRALETRLSAKEETALARKLCYPSNLRSQAPPNSTNKISKLPYPSTLAVRSTATRAGTQLKGHNGSRISLFYSRLRAEFRRERRHSIAASDPARNLHLRLSARQQLCLQVRNHSCVACPHIHLYLGRDQLRENALLKRYFCDVNINDLISFNEDLAHRLASEPAEIIPLVRAAQPRNLSIAYRI